MQNKWIFSIAFLAVLFGIIGLFSQLIVSPTAHGSSSEQPQITPIKMVGVWRAKQPIFAGQLLSAMLFVKDSLPLSKANELGLMQGLLAINEGELSRENLDVDEYLKKVHIVTTNTADYIDLLLAPGMTPYPITIDPFAVYGGQIKVGDYVDVITLMSKSGNIAGKKRLTYAEMTVSPLLVARRVLAISPNNLNATDKSTKQKSQESAEENRIIIELTRQEVAKMAIAKRIGIIEIYKTVDAKVAQQTRADSKDVLPRSNTITQFRGTTPASQ